MPDIEYARDFFIHHADGDLAWAEWIAAELEAAGHGVILTAWDVRPGHDRLDELNKALSTSRHTLLVLPVEQDAEVAARTAAHFQGLQGKERALIPIQVGEREVPPSIATLLAIELGDVDESEARRRLLEGVAERMDRVPRAGFPGKSAKQVRFPGAEHEVYELRGHRADPGFTGRDELMAELYRDLRSGSSGSAVQAITGLGGLGKTQIAIEYADRHGAAYDLVWWVRAEDQATLRGDFVELARELGLPFDTDDQATAALRQLLRRRRNWLLIFDNAEDPQEVMPLLPDKLLGHVLITSRRPEWPHARTRQLEVLDVPTAVEYLVQRGRLSSTDTAKELAEALGCLPLALAQAASVIAGGMAGTKYLDHLHRQSPQLFQQGGAGNHQTTIASTWRVSFERLADRSPAAVALFRLAAFLGAEAIPLDQIVPVPGMPDELIETLTDDLNRAEATRALGEYSLAKTGDGLMSIHRMVQTVTRTELGADEQRWAGIALAAMNVTFPAEAREPESWPTCETMLAHALSSAQHARRLQVGTAEAVDLLDRIAHYLLVRGRLDRAAAVVEDALTAAGQLPLNALEYLRCRNAQGLILLSRGDYHGARQAQEEVYQARIQQLGAHDVETLRAGRDLVEVLYRQGHWAQATTMQNELVDAFTAALGSDHVETVTAVAYQATLLHAAGQFQLARVLEEQVADTRARLLGVEHPHTILATANLAGTLHSQGELSEARTMQEHVLDARRRLLGAEHPETLRAIANLASILHAQGELSEARTMQEHVLDAQRRLLGPEHPDTILANANLANTLRDHGELSEARTMEEHVLDARRRLLGAEHPETLRAIANLASTLHAQGELNEARTMEEHVLDARRRLLGAEHPDTLRAIGNLADTFRTQGELSEARTMEEHVLDARRRLLGAEHPDTIRAIANLAATLHAQKETAHSRLLLREALNISSRVHGKKNPITSKIAMQLLSTFDSPHEVSARKAIIVHNLSWLSKEPPANLSGEQKSIKERLKGLLFGGGKPTKRRQPRGKK